MFPEALNRLITSVCLQIEKKLQRTDVETAFRRHHMGPIDGLPEIRRTTQHYRIEGLRGTSVGLPFCRETLHSLGQRMYFLAVRVRLITRDDLRSDKA